MNAVFTICARNYLAQAKTLLQSIKRQEDIVFFIFLTDSTKGVDAIPIITLNDDWIPNWRCMAFKYDVMEFSTSVKPFCFRKLFAEGYNKVVYLDPDTYVTSSLQYIWNILENKSIILTPHFLDNMAEPLRAVDENEIRLSGIFNLGFVGIKNNTIGHKITDWWCSKLANYCYSEPDRGYFVDQKWMDYVPAFFSDDMHISRHYGMNVAIWNLHERVLLNDHHSYKIESKSTGDIFDLIFFHFSGFNPYDQVHIDPKRGAYELKDFSSFRTIIEEYRIALLTNGYDTYHNIDYSFNIFSNGEYILNINRIFYSKMIFDGILSQKENPFDAKGATFQIMEKNKLLSGVYSGTPPSQVRNIRNAPYWNNKFESKGVHLFLKIIKRFGGVNKYISLIWMFKRYGILENHYSIILKDELLDGHFSQNK